MERLYAMAELLLDIYLHKKCRGTSPNAQADFDQPSTTA
jgi:hypothetical protein